MTVKVFVFSVDQEFDTVSGFLLKRTKDMVNKYRQLLVREAQVRPTSSSAPAFVKRAKIKRASASSQWCSEQTDDAVCLTGECELFSTAGESVGRDGDAGASLSPG